MSRSWYWLLSKIRPVPNIMIPFSTATSAMKDMVPTILTKRSPTQSCGPITSISALSCGAKINIIVFVTLLSLAFVVFVSLGIQLCRRSKRNKLVKRGYDGEAPRLRRTTWPAFISEHGNTSLDSERINSIWNRNKDHADETEVCRPIGWERRIFHDSRGDVDARQLSGTNHRVICKALPGTPAASYHREV